MKHNVGITICAVTLCTLLLCGCSQTPMIEKERVPHATTMTYCSHGNNYYFYGYHNGNFNPALDTEIPLCFDPLCSHMEYNKQKEEWYSICPQYLGRSMQTAITYTSDGEYLYMACVAENADHSDAMKRSIYRYDPENPFDLKRITTYSDSGPLFGAPIYIYDGMIYYPQGIYNEDFVRGGIETADDQYMQIMCVKATGGEGMTAIDEKFHVDNKFYMDEENYYIINYNGPLTVIDRETHEKTEVLCDGLSPSLVYTVDGVQYLVCNEDSYTASYESEQQVTYACVYQYENGICTKLIGGAHDIQIMDGALWYIPHEETYYGSREMFNGLENELFDYISIRAGELHRLDLATGEEKVWKNEDPDLDLWFVGASDRIAIVCPRSVKGEYDGEAPWRTPRYWKAELGEDGVIRLLQGIEE
ncbi:MAG: hypothetical protein E7604_14240 [Ruminococcaceae bacterium]|nr:hypothetical protein [Oscillospiraceae bacterium]